MRLHRVAAALIALSAAPAAAEVKSATPVGFEVEHRAVVAAVPDAVWAMLARPGAWWEAGHTYSGDAANLSLEPRVGGCFCEALSGGGRIEHLRVVYARPGELLRLQGGLGPLQAEGAAGTLTWTLSKVAGGTEITQSYVVGGYIRMGPEKLAPLVDQVMGAQLAGLAKRLGR